MQQNVNHTLNLYEIDFYAWTQEQSRLIQQRAFDQLDLINLQDEVESMGKHETRELESRLEVLLVHLLKWQYQANRRTTSWELTIKEQRRRIAKCLKKMPSLKSQLPELFLESYEDARYSTAIETNLSYKAFPEICEWTIVQVLDDSFLPN